MVHSCVLSDESPRPITLSCGPKTLVTLIRDDMKRNKVACNHSVTHMLNYVLRQVRFFHCVGAIYVNVIPFY